jgi:hypothetical protein
VKAAPGLDLKHGHRSDRSACRSEAFPDGFLGTLYLGRSRVENGENPGPELSMHDDDVVPKVAATHLRSRGSRFLAALALVAYLPVVAVSGPAALPPGMGLGGTNPVYTDSPGFSALTRFDRVGTHREVFSGLAAGTTEQLAFAGPTAGLDALYFSRAIGDRDEASRFAVGLGRVAFSAGTGSGDGRPAQDHVYSLAPSNLFHGAVDQRYRSYDLGLRLSLGERSGVSLGSGTLESPGREDRQAHFVGFDSGRLSLAAFDLRRGGDAVGQGFDLRWGFGRLDFGYSALNSRQDARWQRLGLDFHADRGRSFGVHLESRDNALFQDVADIGMMFSFRQELGSVRRSLNEASAPERGASRGTLILAGLGAGALAAAAVSSSGSSDSDSSARFGGQDQAAFAALADINPTSVRENREYGGSIYRNPDGSFSRSAHVRGEFKQVVFNPHAIVPNGTLATAYYHTHGRANPNYLDEQFSPQDLQFARFYSIDGYLGTPAGRMFLYDLRKDRIFQFRDASGSEFILPN